MIKPKVCSSYHAALVAGPAPPALAPPPVLAAASLESRLSPTEDTHEAWASRSRKPASMRPRGTAVAQPARPLSRPQTVATLVILFGPLAGTLAAAVSLFGHGVDLCDVVLAVAFYAVTGHGVTAGYHRLFAHRGFTARRAVKIALCLAGSLAFEGTVIGWVANHRRHHAYTDQIGDPHSPHLCGDGPWPRARGLLHAHMGWLIAAQPADIDRWAPDVASDPDLVVVSRLFPLLCLLSLGAPALLGWAVTGRWSGALGGFVWGGLVRVFFLQQATFAVNSACHVWGSRPFRTRSHDRSTNIAPLALLSLGENWHNAHHANPRMARHGVDRFQLDSTARLIRLLEVARLVSAVHWPSPSGLEARRCPQVDRGGQAQWCEEPA